MSARSGSAYASASISWSPTAPLEQWCPARPSSSATRARSICASSAAARSHVPSSMPLKAAIVDGTRLMTDATDDGVHVCDDAGRTSADASSDPMRPAEQTRFL